MNNNIKPTVMQGRVYPIEKPRLVDSALEAVRHAILQGRIAPGERLLEVPLARELGISRSSLREALHLLEKDGIIYSLPRHGKFVQTFDLAAIDELYSLRKVLECFAADLVCQRINADGIAALNGALAQLQEAADRGDVSLLARRDITLHQTLIELTHHTLLRRSWTENIAGKLRVLLNVTEQTHRSLQDVLDRHWRLVEGIASGDQGLAQELIRQHIDDAWERARMALLKRSSEEA